MKAPRSETVNRVLRNPKTRAALFKALRSQDDESAGEEVTVQAEDITVVIQKRADGDVIIKSVQPNKAHASEAVASSG